MARTGTTEWVEDVLTFWFGLTRQRWFKAGAELDVDVRERFLET